MSEDRSKYRNPDMPVGYVKKDSELRYKEGEEIDGYHYIYVPYLYNAHIDEREDYATLSDLILSDEDIIVENEEDAEGIVEDVVDAEKDAEISKSCAVSPSKLDKKEETVIAIEENVEFGGVKKKIPKQVKKDIDSEKHKKITKKSKKDSKKDYRSDSSSPSSHKNHSPSSSHKNHSPSSSHKNHSSSSSRKSHSPSFSCKSHSPSSGFRSNSTSSSHRHHSSSSDKHRKIVTYSPSPSPPPLPPPQILPPPPFEQYHDAEIKEEALEKPQHLFGSYHCEVCNVTMNSLLIFKTHVNGKRHRKHMKAKNVSDAVQNIPATVISEDESKYPKPPPGVIRRKSHKLAEIQYVIESMVKTPCPGLYLVTEIQGISGIQYYCTMCDCACSSSSIVSHITGFKHQLRSIKEFKPESYECMINKPKFKIERKILNILHEVQKKQGMGRMAVEVEELVTDSENTSCNSSQSSRSRDFYIDQPSTSRGTSRKSSGISFHELYNKATVPNKSASDFFCETCQSHMNSAGMWEAHIRGKRHLTNLRKMPGDLPSKTKTVLVPNKRAFILDRLKKECPDEPIVGLKEVRETEIPETRSHSYQCFLCGSCHTTLDIIEHLISLKHRSKYLEHINFPGREVTFGMGDAAAYNLIRDMCAQVEESEGWGMPAVHVDKSSLFYL